MLAWADMPATVKEVRPGDILGANFRSMQDPHCAQADQGRYHRSTKPVHGRGVYHGETDAGHSRYGEAGTPGPMYFSRKACNLSYSSTLFFSL